MTKGPITNVVASVNQRLLDIAKQSNRRFNDLVQGVSLAAAIQATFSQRQTPLEMDPICFSDAFAYAPSKTAQ